MEVNMNKQRVKEIVSSPDRISVTYNGSQVYIETVNENTNTASIHYLNKPADKLEVSLNNLIEQ